MDFIKYAAIQLVDHAVAAQRYFKDPVATHRGSGVNFFG
jgi:hypothetical protein